MAGLEAYRRRLKAWQDEAETNAHGMAKYADRAIRLLSDQIKCMEGRSNV